MPSKYQRSVADEQRKRRMKRIILETVISILLIAPAIFFTVGLKDRLNKKMFDSLKLKPGSEGYQNWMYPPISTTRNYYLFNITNPLDVVLDPKETTIKFQDTPPYAYNIKTSKTNVQWSEDNKKVSYAVERLYTRDPKRFNPSSVNDTGVFVDLLRATFRTQFGSKPTPAFYTLGGKNPFYYRNAVEQLEGFTSDLFKSIQEKMYGPNTGMSGLVYRQNGSRLYNVSIETGK